MSEQPHEAQVQPEDGSHASVSGDVDEPGGGRTRGETSVDDAIGESDEGEGGAPG